MSPRWRRRSSSGNIQWDVVDIEAVDLERACSEGLLEVIPRDHLPAGDDGTPAVDDFYPASLSNECGVGIMFWALIYAYNTETIKGGTPTTVADFFDTAKFPGKRALRKRPQGAMEWALIADGVPAAEVYKVLATEEGQARAFAKLSTIKNDLVFYDSWSQAPQLLNDGGAVMVQVANGRVFSAIKEENRPFVMVWDNNLYDQDVWSILKGTPRLEQALDFVAFATGTKAVAGMQEVAYGPSRKSATPLIDPAIVKDLPTAHLDEGMPVDGLFWADYGEFAQREIQPVAPRPDRVAEDGRPAPYRRRPSRTALVLPARAGMTDAAIVRPGISAPARD